MLCFWRGLCKVYYRRIGGTTKPQLGARSLMFSACPSHPEAQLHHGAPSPLQTPNPPAVELGQTPADCQAVFLGGGAELHLPFPPSPCLQLAIWPCQEHPCLEPRCSQAQARADASLRLHNNLISRGSTGRKEEHEGKRSANNRVRFSCVRTSTTLGCWMEPRSRQSNPRAGNSWLAASPVSPATAPRALVLFRQPEHGN